MGASTYRSAGVGYHFEVTYGLLGRGRAKKLIRAHKSWVASGKKRAMPLPDTHIASRLKVTESRVYESFNNRLPTEKFTVRDRWAGRLGVQATYGVRPMGATLGRGIFRHRTRNPGKDRVTYLKGGTYHSVTTREFRGEPVRAPSTQKTKQSSAGTSVTTKFEPQRLAAAVERSSKNNLLRIGYLIRRSAQASMGPRRNVSVPGNPPSSHNGSLRNRILYAWDNVRKSVVIGATRANGASNGQAPRALEYGGPSTMLRVIAGVRKRIQINIAPRPYMRPALHRTMPQFPQFFSNSFGG